MAHNDSSRDQLSDEPSDSQEHALGSQENQEQEEHRDEGAPSQVAPPADMGATGQTFQAMDIMAVFRSMMREQTESLRREFQSLSVHSTP